MKSNGGPSSTICCAPESTKKFIDVFNEDFGEEGVHGGHQERHLLLQSPRQCRNPASSLVPNQARAPAMTWSCAVVSTWRPPGKDQDDGTVVNATIQAILEISAQGEDERWIMPEKHDANKSVIIIEQCTAFGNLNIGVSFVLHRRSGVVMPITSLDQKSPPPNLAWLQLYAYICAKTGCLHSAELPGATALKALIDGPDNPDTANAGISKIIKRYKAES